MLKLFWICLLWVVALPLGGLAEGPAGPRFAPDPDDRAEQIVDQLQFSSLREMDERGLLHAEVRSAPWSGDYWPMYAGGIARRYMDPRLPSRSDWAEHEAHFRNTTESFRRAAPDLLSPAEKYDLLVGDADFSLTRAMWNEGRSYFERTGKVDYWMGICNGWTAAALNTPRPLRSVTVTAADGLTRIRFYPSDIKALASLLWARGYGQYRSVGKRCGFETPPRGSTGRPLPPECLDTNPATWHLAVVNQVGGLGRSLILDIKADEQVWNQPLFSYRYSYFNPRSAQSVRTLGEAMVDVRDFPQDVYRPFRSSATQTLVGVRMEILYVSETEPDHSATDSLAQDIVEPLELYYDLELDAGGSIVGGEWYSRQHPDFVWAPRTGTRAWSEGDFALERSGDFMRWNGAQYPFPRAWMDVAVRTSRQGQPLERVVSTLVEMSAGSQAFR